MTDNEKRAHDLAIAACIDSVHAKVNAQIKSGNENVTIDYFSEYISAYELALKAFNKKFPPEK